MKAFIAATGLVAGASAAVVARDQCCFQLTASGGASGTVGQLGDGQNRIGGGYSPATYCISNGAITDASGRGCILTPPTTQFQCDKGATPTGGFSINSNGEVEHNGDNTFYACPASNGVYNIYTTPVDNQPKCTKITLSSGGKCIPAQPTMKTTASPMTSCPAPSTVTVTETEKGKQMYTTVTEHQTCPAPSTVTETEMGKQMYTTVTEHQTCPAPSTVTMSECPTSQMAPPPAPTTTEVQTTYEHTTLTTLAPPTTMPYESQPYSMSPPEESSAPPPTKPSGSACPTELTGAYQTPHLIVPVSSEKPDYAYGTQYNATVTSYECTIFNFDIPYSYSGKSCSTIFLFPEQSQLQTSSYDISGHGDLVFSSLSSAANQQTTWNNCPSKKMELGSCSPAPGNSYSIGTSECAAGTTQSIEVCGTGDLSLSFFEDYNPSPIGVYMTSC